VTAYDEERLGELLSALRPAPEAWVHAAQDLPLMRRGLEEIVQRAESDDEFRRRVVAEPEAVLEEADFVAHADAVELLRRRLGEDEQPQA
jgi:hypothetical protein